MRHRKLWKITLAVMLLNLLMTYPMFAGPPIEASPILTGNETRLYSECEVDVLIDDLTAAAHEAIEQVAGEAAKATALATLELQAEAQAQAVRLQKELRACKKNNVRNIVIASLSCFVIGTVVGGTTIYFLGR